MTMTDISKEDLRKEIDAILEGADLDFLSSKKVRQQLEDKLKFDLSDRKKEIDELVMDAVEKKPNKEDKLTAEVKVEAAAESVKEKEKNEKDEKDEPASKKKTPPKLDESIEDEEESESEEETEDEYKPDEDEVVSKKRPARQQERQQPARKGNSETVTKGRPSRAIQQTKKPVASRNKKSSESEEQSEESEESEEEALPTPKKTATPRGRKPVAKPAPVDEDSEESEEERKPVKKRQADSGSEFEEFDEDSNSDSSEDGSDEEYSPGKKSPGKKKGAGGRGGKRRKLADSSDPDDSDEDWKKASRKKRPPPAKKGESASSGSKSRTAVKAVKLSPELTDIVGSDSMIRSEVVKKMWTIIKERNLYDPKNKQFAVCDEQLQKVFGVKRFRTFSMMKYLKSHFLE